MTAPDSPGTDEQTGQTPAAPDVDQPDGGDGSADRPAGGSHPDPDPEGDRPRP